MKISIVSPVYKGEKMVDELVRRIKDSTSKVSEDYEIILVNDASPDGSWHEIEKQCALDRRVKGIDLSRNFGQHYAITAGVSYAQGEWTVVMDCDLQDRPEEIPALYAKAMEGYDIVLARRMHRKDGFFKRLSSTLFSAVFAWLSGTKRDKTIGNYGIYHHKVIEAYNEVKECARSFGSVLYYLGFRRATIDVEHSGRAEGKSSYTLRKLLKLSFDVIISNSNKPLRMTAVGGFAMSAVSLMVALYNVVAHMAGLIKVAGFTTTVFSIWFVGGMILFVLGIIGLYIGKTFDQVKGRPLFVVREEINIERDLKNSR